MEYFIMVVMIIGRYLHNCEMNYELNYDDENELLNYDNDELK